MRRLVLAAVLVAASSSSAATSPTLGDMRRVGTTKLANACSAAVQPELQRAVALLHSFFYAEARRGFTAVVDKEPRCALAHWGVAMTHWHPLWTPPSDDEMKQGLAAAEKADALASKHPIEKALVRAILAYYRAPAGGGEGGQTCHGPTGSDHRARALAYEKEMEALYAKNQKDVEIATLYALALLGTAPPTDKTYANQLKATAILEKFWTTHPSHPGLAHYLIHGYDQPELAERGLPAARAYSAMAPWVPHVLHMPSHIFTRLGMWQDVVDSNLASADAARQYAAKEHADATSFEELHALDYLAYARLQQGDEAGAKEVADRVAGVAKTFPEVDFVSAYALGTVPARWALERRDWAAAAALQTPPRPAWAKLPFAEAGVEFARGFGAARAKKVDAAKKSASRLDELAAATVDPRFAYFAKQVKMQALVVRGWIAHVEGKKAEAEKMLREAADTDDLLGKHPVSPGSLLPAREVLADFLLETGRAKDALVEYEASLRLNPRRLNGVYGAAVAAQKSGDAQKARKHYEQLMQIAPGSARREVAEAKKILASR